MMASVISQYFASLVPRDAQHNPDSVKLTEFNTFSTIYHIISFGSSFRHEHEMIARIPANEGFQSQLFKNRVLTKEFYRTCNFLPFSCIHLALWRGKVKDPR